MREASGETGTYSSTRQMSPINRCNIQLIHIQFACALCHNEIAFNAEIPARLWKKLSTILERPSTFFGKAPNLVETANAELNLQTMYHLSGQKVGLERVEELTRIFEEAGSPKAEKWKKLLEELRH